MTTDAYNKGLGFMRQQREQYAANRSARRENSMYSLWPKKGQIARFWFLTDPSEMMAVLTHPMYRQTRAGKKYPVDVLCSRKTYDDPKESCDYCIAGEKGPFWRMCCYVFVEAIFHEEAPNDEQAKTWKPMRRAEGGTIWREDINRIHFFAMKDAIEEQVEAAFAGDPEDTEWVPTLFDRPYQVSVTGEGSTRRDILQSRDKKAMPDEVKAAMTSAPPLEETVVEKMGERKANAKSAATTDVYDDDPSDPGPTEPTYGDDELITFEN